MSTQTITIIDTACANLSSVQFAFERLGYRTLIAHTPEHIKNADKLLLPGVGTALTAMTNLHTLGLLDAINTATQPILGICLGMQLMSCHSDEGDIDTLGIISTPTQRLPDKGLPIPHMGWNQVNYQPHHPLFTDIKPNSHFYFVHSFAIAPCQQTIATCDYGISFSAAIEQHNFYGVQFHPERSGQNGALLLRNFMEHI